jgi:hypothetical protein
MEAPLRWRRLLKIVGRLPANARASCTMRLCIPSGETSHSRVPALNVRKQTRSRRINGDIRMTAKANHLPPM